MPGPYYRHTEALTADSSADFFFIDTTPINRQYNSWIHRFFRNDQIERLESELAGSTARWKVVVGHHPVYSGETRKASPALVDWLAPLLEKQGVDLYLNGHGHYLEHIVVRGVHYLTSGAGAKPRNANSMNGTRFVRGGTLGFLRMRLTPNTIDFEFIDDMGKSLYRAMATA